MNHVGCYAAVQAASRTFTERLRQEMRPFDVSVHLVDIGFSNIKMENINKIEDINTDVIPGNPKEAYGDMYFDKGKTKVHTCFKLFFRIGNENLLKRTV